MSLRQMHRIDPSIRDAGGDLLAAFILSGWEKLMPLQEAIETSDYLAWHDPEKTRRLSGMMVRGGEMPDDIKLWLRECREFVPAFADLPTP